MYYVARYRCDRPPPSRKGKGQFSDQIDADHGQDDARCTAQAPVSSAIIIGEGAVVTAASSSSAMVIGPRNSMRRSVGTAAPPLLCMLYATKHFYSRQDSSDVTHIKTAQVGESSNAFAWFALGVRLLLCLAWHGMAWHGMAWHGMTWHGMDGWLAGWLAAELQYVCQ